MIGSRYEGDLGSRIPQKKQSLQQSKIETWALGSEDETFFSFYAFNVLTDVM